MEATPKMNMDTVTHTPSVIFMKASMIFRRTEDEHVPPVWYLRVCAHQLRVDVVLLDLGLQEAVQDSPTMVEDGVDDDGRGEGERD